MSSLPLTCDPWAEQEPLGFSVSFAPRRRHYHPTRTVMLTRHPHGFPVSHPCPAFPSYRRRTSRWGQVSDTDPKSRRRHQPTLQSTDSLTTCDLMSQAFRIPSVPRVSSHLAPLALRTTFPSSLVGRYSHDYYGASVAIGFASRRRSHVRRCRTVQREVGAPLISLNVLTGHRFAPRRMR